MANLDGRGDSGMPSRTKPSNIYYRVAFSEELQPLIFAAWHSAAENMYSI